MPSYDLNLISIFSALSAASCAVISSHSSTTATVSSFESVGLLYLTVTEITSSSLSLRTTSYLLPSLRFLLGP